MNVWLGIGKLGKDPESKMTAQGISICTFSIAVERKFLKDGKREIDWINVVTWKGLADQCAKRLHKGSSVAVCGAIQTRSYEAQGGKRYVTEIVADEVKFLDKAESHTEQEPEQVPGFTIVEDDSESDLPF
jgi:single-strand DNA-binding protein